VSSTTAEGVSIHTPMGEVNISGEGAFGIVATSGDVTIHSFLGEEIQFEPAHSLEFLGSEASFRIPEGTSLRLVAQGAGLRVDRGEANERSFVVNVPENTSNLPISTTYVEAVRSDKPLAYWRFERLDDKLVKNEMSDRWHCILKGEVGWHDYAGNRAIEFGQT